MTPDELTKKKLTPSVCLVTIHSFPKIGGGEERFLQYLTSYMEKNGTKFVVVSSTVQRDRANVVGMGIKPFKLPIVGSYPYLLLFSLIACLRIIVLNKDNRFSVVHSIDTGYAGLAGLFASRVLDVQFVVHAHCCRARLVSLSVALRGGLWRHAIPLYEKFEGLIDRLVVTHADKVVAVSGEIRDYILSLNVSTERVLVNPVGLDISALKSSDADKQSVLREFGMPSNAFVIGYLGSLARAKGTHTLIEAFESLRKATDDLFLLIVGDGNRRDFEKEAKRERSSSVIFAGFRRDVARFLAAMDVFVLPSMSEGCPYSLLEAMAAGKAIVASDIPSIREIVRDGREALLVDSRDAKMLEETLLRLCSDSRLRTQLRTSAKKKAAQYDNDTVSSKIVDLYPRLGGDSTAQSRN